MSYEANNGPDLLLAKCSNCGSVIEIDRLQDINACPKCGTQLVTETAISLFSASQQKMLQDFVIENGVLKKYCGAYVNIVIPESVIEIDTEAFKDFRPYLNSVTFPKSLKRINDKAFSKCINLYEVAFNDQLESIGDYAFSGCKYLNNVKLPDSVSNIGSGAFGKCISLTDIKIPNGVTRIMPCTFLDCTSLTKIDFPNNLESISGEAFINCISLKSFSFPNSLVEIGVRAFANCLSIESITFPENIKFSKDGEVFKGCSNLKSVTYTSTGQTRNIGPHMFEDCTSLANFDMKDELVGVRECGFKNCKSLTRIKLSQDFETLEKEAFSGCDALERIDITDSAPVEAIPNSAFANCSSLSIVNLSANIKTIKNDAFKGCVKLTEVNIPSNAQLEIIMKSAFEGCNSLKTTYLPKDLKKIDINAFAGCADLEEIHVPNGTAIDVYSFAETPKLRLFLPNTVNNLERLAIVAEKFNIVLCNTIREMLNSRQGNMVPDLDQYSSIRGRSFAGKCTSHSLLSDMESLCNNGEISLVFVRSFSLKEKYAYDFMTYNDFSTKCIGIGYDGTYQKESNYNCFSTDVNNDYMKVKALFDSSGIKGCKVEIIQSPVLCSTIGIFNIISPKGTRNFVRVKFPYSNLQ